MPVIIPESQTSAWVDEQIKAFLSNLGYEVGLHKISQNDERFLPLDTLFDVAGVKLFGLQHKALHRDLAHPQPNVSWPFATDSDYWDISLAQDEALQSFDWIHYALCEITWRRHSSTALHQTYFPPRMASTLDIYWPSVYQSWGGRLRRRVMRKHGEVPLRWIDFFWRLFSGDAGVTAGEPDEVRRLFRLAISAATLDGQNSSAQHLNDLSMTLFALNPLSGRAQIYAAGGRDVGASQ